MKKLILTLALLTLAVRVSAYRIPYESWMGIYIGERKAGYICLKIDDAEQDGVKGYRIASCFSDRIAVLGVELTQLVNTVVFTDANYTPLKESFSMTSGGKVTEVNAKFNKDAVECVISAGSGSSTKTIPIPPGAKLISDSMLTALGAKPEVGQHYKMNYFNPLTLAVEDLSLKVERKEKITVEGKEFDAFLVQADSPMGGMTMWEEADGDAVKIKSIMGITMIRQNKKEAMAGIKGGSQADFAGLTTVKPNRSIPSPRECRMLEVVLKGMPDDTASDARQKVTPVDGSPGSVRFRITASDFSAESSISIPVEDQKFAEHLASTAYLDCDTRAIKEQAKQIVGQERNAYKACCKIRSWISANLHTQADIGITRSGSDVLKSRVGVCRDYAILFASLARSAGIPAKVTSGLVFTEGAFYYHAWVECYVGQWVPFDGTMSTDFVDATHIKLAEGDATSMFGLARVIGNLKVEVKSSSK